MGDVPIAVDMVLCVPYACTVFNICHFGRRKIQLSIEVISIGSLKWEIHNTKIDVTKLPQHHRGQVPQQQSMDDSTAPIMTQTVKQYKNHAIKFGEWCKQTHGCRHMPDCLPYVQEYIDHLQVQGKSASTIHTYVAGICRLWGVPMDAYTLPLRVVAENTRSRGAKPSDKRKDTQRAASPALFDFASMVGIRRAEYADLRGNDFRKDEAGLYVLVRKGKGGKRQKQRVLPCDEMAVRAYFDGSAAYMFTKAELKNKIDLHHLRELQAQRAYNYYLNRIEHEDGYREKLIEQLRHVWKRDDIIRAGNGKKPKRWSARLYTGTYWLRKDNRSLARELGRPVGYDRLALLAASVFCLSHWRHDVTIANYLLAHKPGDPDYFNDSTV